MGQHNNDHHPDYNNLPNGALILRGTLNQRANEIATAILRDRGCVSGVTFLREWHQTFTRTDVFVGKPKTNWTSYTPNSKRKQRGGWLIDHDEERRKAA